MAKGKSKRVNWLLEYKKAIDEGKIIVGQEMMQGLEMYIKDLDNPKYYMDLDEPNFRIEFIETFCKHSKDPFSGQPFILELWQKAFITCLYGFKIRATGRDRFKRALLLISRKNGKSTLCAALAFTELMVGGAGKDVVCSANNDEQSKIIFEEIVNMADQFDPKMKRVRKNRDKIEFKKNKSKIKRVSDRKKNILGLNINFAICDETNELETGETPSKLIKSMSLKPNPKFINITTEGMVFDGYLDKELIKAREILDGERTDASSESLLVWLYTQDSKQEIYTVTAETMGDIEHPCVWQKSNPSLYSVKSPQYLLEQIAESRIDKGEKLQTECFDFNIKSNVNESWLMESDFNYLQEEWSLEEFRNCYAIAGVDLSFTNDLTCVKLLLQRAVHPKTGEPDNMKYIATKYFIPTSKIETTSKDSGSNYKEWVTKGYIEATEGNQNDLTKVADWLGMLYKEYGIRTFITGYDDRFSNDFKNRMDEWGFEYELIQQNRFVMSDPMKSVEADLKSQLINYNNNPVDKWCFANTCVKADNQGYQMAEKIKGQPDRKIDGSVTLIILYATLKRYRTEFLNKVF